MKKLIPLFILLQFAALQSIAQKVIHVHDNYAPAENLVPYFNQASEDYHVPVQLLMAVGYAESHWRQRIPNEHDKHMPPSYGVMGLRNDAHFGHSLNKAASLIHAPVALLKKNAKDNIRGAAAYLAYLRLKTRSSEKSLSDDIKAWEPVLEKYSGIPQPNIARLYAHDVYAILLKGVDQGPVQIPAMSIDQQWLDALDQNSHTSGQRSAPTGGGNPPALTPDYSSAIWVAASASNYAASNRPTTYAINLVVMHDMEGTYASSVSWFQDPAAGACAHYLIRSSDGQVTQMVQEHDVAWHTGNSAYNNRSIGIEEEGYYDDPSYYTSNMYTSAANLVAYLCTKYSIPKTHEYIIGHNQVPNPNNTTQWGGANQHQDPGGFYNWRTLIQQVSGIAPTFKPVTVTAGSLNLRTEPNASAPLITTLSQGQQFVQYGTAANGWALIFIPGSNSEHYDGWCSNSFLTVDSCASQIEVTGTWPGTLNTRPSATNSTTILDKVADGQRFVTTGSPQTGYDGNTGWRNFYTPASTTAATGWASGVYLNYIPGAGAVLPTITLQPSAIAMCSNGSATFTSSFTNGGTAPTFQWYAGGAQAGTGTSYTLSNPSASTTVYCVITSNAACLSQPTAQSNNITVNVTTVPAIPAFAPATPTGCDQVALSAVSSGCSNCSYQWSTPSGTVSGDSVTATSSGSYSVTASNTGCTATNTVAAIITASPHVAIAGDTVICAGGSGATLTASGTGTAYVWSNSLGSNSTANVNPTITTAYTVTATNGNCSAVSSATVHVTSSPVVSITSGGPVSFCDGRNVTLTASPAGSSYLWSNGSNGVASITVDTSGSYTVTVTNAGGCVGSYISQTPMVVTVHSNPAVISMPDTTIQSGQTAQLNITVYNGTAPYAYVWSPTSLLDNADISSPLASPSDTTNFNVIVTDNNGCTATGHANVNVETPVAVCDTSIHPVVSVNGNSVIASYFANANYHWQLNGNSITDTTRFITAASQGYYTVIVNIGNCSYSSNDVFYTGINELSVQHLSISPNPSKGEFVISFETSRLKEVEISIYDVLGQRIMQAPPVKVDGVYSKEIKMNGQATGMYILQLKAGDKVLNRKIEVN